MRSQENERNPIIGRVRIDRVVPAGPRLDLVWKIEMPRGMLLMSGNEEKRGVN